jgi:hypothetical protein
LTIFHLNRSKQICPLMPPTAFIGCGFAPCDLKRLASARSAFRSADAHHAANGAIRPEAADYRDRAGDADRFPD